MAYQTVLVHLDVDPHCAARVACAARLLAPGGMLVGAAMSGVSRLLYRSAPAPDSDRYLGLHLAFLRERASAALAAFDQQMSVAGMPASEGRLIDDEAAGGLALQARVADLVVLSQSSEASDLVAQLLPQAGRPVLLVPAAFRASDAAPRFPQRVLVAWDGGVEAGRALASALPLLRYADLVELVVCEADPAGPIARDLQWADPLPWLARHGVNATLQHHTLGGSGRFNRNLVGDALLELASDSAADLLVMGAYAHSRMRESLLGGVTRTVLAHMHLPVLLEH